VSAKKAGNSDNNTIAFTIPALENTAGCAISYYHFMKENFDNSNGIAESTAKLDLYTISALIAGAGNFSFNVAARSTTTQAGNWSMPTT